MPRVRLVDTDGFGNSGYEITRVGQIGGFFLLGHDNSSNTG